MFFCYSCNTVCRKTLESIETLVRTCRKLDIVFRFLNSTFFEWVAKGLMKRLLASYHSAWVALLIDMIEANHCSVHYNVEVTVAFQMS